MRGLLLRPNRHERLRRAAVLKGKHRNPVEKQMRAWYLERAAKEITQGCETDYAPPAGPAPLCK